MKALATLASALLLALLPACGQEDPSLQAPGSGSALPSGHPVIGQGLSSDVAGGTETLAGEVLETLESGGYTYARILTEAGEVWVAGPVTPLEVGSRLSLSGAAAMGSFTSTSLHRTFDDMYFVGAFLDDPPPAGSRRGVAKQVLAGSGYTYVEVDVTEAISWIAGPRADVREGDTVAWQGGNEMGQFHSPTLNRTFDNILFVERIWVER